MTDPPTPQTSEPAKILVLARMDASTKGAGVSVRIAGIIEALAATTTVRLVLLRTPGSPVDSAPAAELCDRLGIEWIESVVVQRRVHILQATREWWRIAFRRWHADPQVRELVASADQVWVCQMHPLLDLGIPPHRSLVVDIDTAAELLWDERPQRRAFGVKLHRRTVRRLRKRLGKESAVVLLAAEDDALIVGPEVAPACVGILPNTAPAPSVGQQTRLAAAQTARPPCVIMIGDMAYDPNLDGAEWLIKEVWPLVEYLRPDARLRMIGRNACHLANRCPELRSTISIHPDVQDLSEDLLEASLSVAPMPKVTGTPIKVLQSLVWQVPVVATSVVAGAFGNEAAEFLLVADSPDDFARAIVRLLEDDDLRSRMVAAGLDRFQRHHSAARFTESIDALVEFAGDSERTGGESQRRLRLEQRGIRPS